MVSRESAKHTGNCGGYGAPASIPFKERLVAPMAEKLSADSFHVISPSRECPLEKKALVKVKEQPTSNDWSRQGCKGSVLDKPRTVLAGLHWDLIAAQPPPPLSCFLSLLSAGVGPRALPSKCPALTGKKEVGKETRTKSKKGREGEKIRG